MDLQKLLESLGGVLLMVCGWMLKDFNARLRKVEGDYVTNTDLLLAENRIMEEKRRQHDEYLEQFRQIFVKFDEASKTRDELNNKLGPMSTSVAVIQERAGALQQRMDALTARVDAAK